MKRILHIAFLCLLASPSFFDMFVLNAEEKEQKFKEQIEIFAEDHLRKGVDQRLQKSNFILDTAAKHNRWARPFVPVTHTVNVTSIDRTFFRDFGAAVAPGDTVLIGSTQQDHKSIVLYNLQGTRALPIVVMPTIGPGIRYVGDTAWNYGGNEDGWQVALMIEKSSHIRVLGERPDGRGTLEIHGSKAAGRGGYMNFQIANCNDIEVNGVKSFFGGTGFWAKTEVNRDDPQSWSESGRSMGALKMLNCTAIGTANEGYYLGYTNQFVELNHVFTNPDGTTYTGYYYVDLLPGQALPNLTTHKRPLRWTSIRVEGCVADSTGGDGIQTARADTIIVRNNVVTRHGYYNKTGSNWAHAAGIIVGGGSGGYKGKLLVENNIIRGGWGERLQLFGDGNNSGTLAGSRVDTVKNNLLDKGNQGLAIAIKGDSALRFVFQNNTIVQSKDHSVRINGRNYAYGVNGMPYPQIFNANIMIEPAGLQFYTENPQFVPHEAGIVEGTGSNANLKYSSLATAPVDQNNYYLPTNGATQGYRFTGTTPSPNQPPTVFAGANQSITLPTNSTTLSGSASDADGSVASRLWQFVSGPSAGTLSTPTALTTTLSGLTQGVYVYRLTITDNEGATASDDVQITVNAAAGTNIFPTVNAGADQSFTERLSTTLTGTASDADGTIASRQWERVSGPTGITFSAPTALSTTVTGLLVGTYVFRLTVTDNQGAQSSDEVTVIVLAATAPPQNLKQSTTIDIIRKQQ